MGAWENRQPKARFAGKCRFSMRIGMGQDRARVENPGAVAGKAARNIEPPALSRWPRGPMLAQLRDTRRGRGPRALPGITANQSQQPFAIDRFAGEIIASRRKALLSVAAHGVGS